MKPLLENDFATYEIRKGVLFCRFKKGCILALPAAKKISEGRIICQNGTAYPILCDIRQVINADKAAKDYFISHSSHLITVLVFVVSNELEFAMVKYFVSSSKTIIPIKAYYSEEKAIAALKEYFRTGTLP